MKNPLLSVSRFLLCLLIVTFFIQPGFSQLRPLPNPAPVHSFTPNLHLSPKGKIYLSWQTKGDHKKHHLFLSQLKGQKWTKPVQVASEDKKWFVNWADFPAMTTFGKNSLALNYLQKSTSKTFSYDVKLIISNNGGKTWQPSFTAHNDGTPTEHGFVSLAPASHNRFLAIWLDGRETAQKQATHDHSHGHSNPKKAMTLRAAFFDKKGEASEQTLLDNRICDCCQTSLAQTSNGYVAVYRNRSEKEIRDIGYVTYQNGKWSQPKILNNDGWKINGCPVNGPAISAYKNKVATAWFTMANNKPRVQVAFSDNGGLSFGQPTQVDEGDPLGRVATAVLPNGNALVVWLEMKGKKTLLRLRKISKKGQTGEPYTIAETSQGRSSGFPQIIVKNKQAVIAWTSITKDKNGKILKQMKTAVLAVGR